MADEDDVTAPWLILFRQKVATLRRFDAQHREETRGDAHPTQPLRFTTASQIIGGAPVGLDLLADRLLFLPIQEVTWRDRELWELRQFGFTQHDQPIRVLVGEG